MHRSFNLFVLIAVCAAELLLGGTLLYYYRNLRARGRDARSRSAYRYEQFWPSMLVSLLFIVGCYIVYHYVS